MPKNLFCVWLQCRVVYVRFKKFWSQEQKKTHWTTKCNITCNVFSAMLLHKHQFKCRHYHWRTQELKLGGPHPLPSPSLTLSRPFPLSSPPLLLPYASHPSPPISFVPSPFPFRPFPLSPVRGLGECYKISQQGPGCSPSRQRSFDQLDS